MTRLLAHETLTPDQVWWVVACDPAETEPEDLLVLADSRRQVEQSLQRARRDTWVALNEAELEALIQTALPSEWARVSQKILQTLGLPDWWVPRHRYGLGIRQDDDVLRWFWFTAPNPAAALHQLNELRMGGELIHLIDVQALMDLRHRLKSLRENRGEGAFRDARFEGQLDDRQRLLAVEAHGGEGAYRARLEALRASLGQANPPDPGVIEVPV